MTTINGKSYELNQVVENAVAKAADGFVCPPDTAAASKQNNPQKSAYMMTIARYIGKQTGFTPDWSKLNENNLVDSLTELVTIYNKSAGKRAVVKKYGHDTARKMIYSATGRNIR